MYYLCSEIKDADQLAVTAQLVSAFFTYAKIMFSYDVAHIMKVLFIIVSIRDKQS